MILRILLNALLKVIAGSLGRIVISTVKELDGLDISNESKRQKAFETIKENAVEEGKNLRTNLINLIIEIGVALIRKKK